jgi:RNA polymerase sigma-70 factor (ECF subfamily)
MMAPSTQMEHLVTETAWLRRLARSLVKDDALADDLVQDTFVTAAEKAPRDGRPLRPWLFRVLVNRVRMAARSGARRSARESRLGELALPPVGPDELVTQVETQRMLADLVLALPPAQRDVLLLHYYEGLSSIAIGKRLGIPAGTARWRLKQALDELRARLDERQPNRAWVVALAQFGTRGPRAAPVAALAPVLFALALALVIVVAIVVRVADLATRSDPPRAERPDFGARVPRTPLLPVVAPATVTVAGEEYAVLRIEGQVIDDHEQPVAGAQVHLDVECSYAAAKQPAVETGTDGSFVFVVEPRCHYWFYVEAGALRARAGVKTDPTEPVILTLRAEPELAMRIIDSETEVPIPGATLSLDDVTVEADADGRVRTKLGISRWAKVFAPGYVSQQIQLASVWSGEQLVTRRDPATGEWQGFTQKAEPGTTTELVFPLEKGLRRIDGRVVDLDGAPAAGCDIEVYDQPRRRDEGFGVTGDDGRFMVWVRDSDYALTARYRPQSRKVVVAESEQHDLAATETTVSLTLSRMVARDVTVTVLDASGRPAVRAEVSSLHGSFRTGYTNDRGVFTIRSLDNENAAVARLGEGASPVTMIGKSTTTTLRLAEAGLAGTVIDANGEPMPDVWVGIAKSELTDHIGTRQMTTDQNGRFAFDVPPGSYVLVAAREGVFDNTERRTTVQAANRDVRIPID